MSSQSFYPVCCPILGALLLAACGGSGETGGAGPEGPPTVVSAPVQVSGLEQTIELSLANPSGADKILIVQLMIAPNLNSQKSCWIEFAPGEKNVRMMDGSGEGKAGEPGSLGNSQCTIDTAQLKHTVEGNSLRVSVPVRLEPGTVGPQNIFALASAAAQHSGWQTMGTWTREPVAAK